MRFLFKIAVLGFVGMALLPAFAPEKYKPASSEAADSAAMPSVSDLASLVGEAASDMRGMCERQPDVCRKGQELLTYSGMKAREGLVIAYAMFRHGHPSMQQDERDGGPAASSPPAADLPAAAAASK